MPSGHPIDGSSVRCSGERRLLVVAELGGGARRVRLYELVCGVVGVGVLQHDEGVLARSAVNREAALEGDGVVLEAPVERHTLVVPVLTPPADDVRDIRMERAIDLAPDRER